MTSEEEMENPIYSAGKIVGESVPVAVPSVVAGPVEKINSLVQKEAALAQSGVTRYKYMLVIAEALEATKWVDEPDVQGNIKRVLVPDVRRREWGAKQAARLYGDMIERKEIEHDLGDKTLDRFRVLSVAQLKAKALELASGLGHNRVVDV